MYLVLGGVPSSGGVPGPRGMYLVPGSVPGPKGVYLVPGGVYLVLGGVPGPGGCTWSQGLYLFPGGVPGPGGTCPGTLPPRGQTDTCKNITLATSLRTVKIQRLDQGLNPDHLLGSVSQANHYTRIFSVLV